jgi:DNA damage-binding protein 1
VPSTTRGKHTLELSKLASYRTSTNPLSLSVTPSTIDNRATIAVADLMKSLSIVEVRPPTSTNVLWGLKELSRHFATVWSSATAVTGENEWVVADMEGNLAIMKRNLEGVTADDKKRLQVTGEFRLGEVVNRIVPIFAPGSSSASLSGKGKERSRTLSSAANPMLASMDVDGPVRTGPIVLPRAFLATVEGAIYMLGTINASYTDALLRLQASMASKVLAPGYMPWTKFRAWKTEVSERDEPFRFVDGEMVEQGLLRLSDADLEGVLREAGLTEGTSKVTMEEVRAWGEELRRLY